MNSKPILSFLPMRPKMDHILPTRGTLWVHRRPRPSFSLSAYWRELNRGRELDRRRMCLAKKPLFWVEKDG